MAGKEEINSHTPAVGGFHKLPSVHLVTLIICMTSKKYIYILNKKLLSQFFIPPHRHCYRPKSHCAWDPLLQGIYICKCKTNGRQLHSVDGWVQTTEVRVELYFSGEVRIVGKVTDVIDIHRELLEWLFFLFSRGCINVFSTKCQQDIVDTLRKTRT